MLFLFWNKTKCPKKTERVKEIELLILKIYETLPEI